MDSRYLILPTLLTLLSSCSFGGTPTETDFSSMYEARVHTQVQGIRDFAKDFGYMESYAIDGSLMA